MIDNEIYKWIQLYDNLDHATLCNLHLVKRTRTVVSCGTALSVTAPYRNSKY